MPAVRVVPLPKLRLVQLVERMIVFRGRPAYRPTYDLSDGQPEASACFLGATAALCRGRGAAGDDLDHAPE